MVQFSEAFAGGFFGFGRTYAAAATIECTSHHELQSDWHSTLNQTTQWRSHRGERATTLHLYLQIPPTEVWTATGFILGKLLVPPSSRPQELLGLRLEVAVFGIPEMEQYLDLILYPEEPKAVEALAKATN